MCKKICLALMLRKAAEDIQIDTPRTTETATETFKFAARMQTVLRLLLIARMQCDCCQASMLRAAAWQCNSRILTREESCLFEWPSCPAVLRPDEYTEPSPALQMAQIISLVVAVKHR